MERNVTCTANITVTCKAYKQDTDIWLRLTVTAPKSLTPNIFYANLYQGEPDPTDWLKNMQGTGVSNTGNGVSTADTGLQWPGGAWNIGLWSRQAKEPYEPRLLAVCPYYAQ